MKAYLITSCILLWAGCGMAQSSSDKDEKAIIELGGASAWNIPGGAWSGGPDFAVEFTPIEHWLEIEAGVTPMFSAGHSTEWGVDLLFKKPWTLSKSAEFMFGAGPEWVHTKTANSVAGEVAGDFMFWPGGRHKFGWFLEPGYEYTFAHGHEKSFGISAGLLISIP